MNIAIDIDGVLRDQTTALKNKYLEVYPEHKDLIKPVTAWGIHEFYPIGKEIYKLWFGEWCKECMEDAPIFDGALEFMQALKDAGHKVYLLTSQPIRTERYTLAWVDKHHIPHDGILFCSDKGLTRFDVLLADGEHNLKAFASCNALAVAFDQPWNQEWTGPRVKGATEKDKYEIFIRTVGMALHDKKMIEEALTHTVGEKL